MKSISVTRAEILEHKKELEKIAMARGNTRKVKRILARADPALQSLLLRMGAAVVYRSVPVSKEDIGELLWMYKNKALKKMYKSRAVILRTLECEDVLKSQLKKVANLLPIVANCFFL